MTRPASALHHGPCADELSSIDRWLFRQQFGVPVRKRIYSALGVLVDNHVQIMKALEDIYATASDDGARPKRAQAVILADVIEKVSSGQTLARAFSAWVDPQETSVIAAGEQSGALRQALADVVQLLESRERIGRAARAAMLYPGFLMLLVVVVIAVISIVVVPKLTAITDPSTWERFARALYVLSEFVMAYGVVVLLGLATAVALIAWSLPRLTGDLRVRLDRLPPWSIYRMIQGSIFMLNLGSMLKAGVKLHDALQITIAHADPWLKERAVGALLGTSVGRTFGQALQATGHGFPDNESIRYLKTLSALDGFDKSLSDYAQSTLEITTTKVEAGAKVLMVVALATIVMFVLLVVGAISDIQAAIDAGINH